jgi:DNA replicative helicase MCM subunit Mcm2 (Cdc46/Mcm family)
MALNFLISEEKRKDHDSECVDRYVKSRAMSSRSSDSRLSYIDEQTNSKAVKDYIRNRGKKRPPLAEEIKRSQSTDRPLGARSDSVLTTRSLPTPATLRTVEEV